MDEKKPFKIDTSILYNEEGIQVSDAVRVEDTGELGEIIDVERMNSEDSDFRSPELRSRQNHADKMEEMHRQEEIMTYDKNSCDAVPSGRVDLDVLDAYLSDEFELDGERYLVDVGETDFPDVSPVHKKDGIRQKEIDCDLVETEYREINRETNRYLSADIRCDQQDDQRGKQLEDQSSPETDDRIASEEIEEGWRMVESSETEESQNDGMSFPLQLLYGILVWVALGFAFIYPYRYLSQYIPVQAEEIHQTDSPDQSADSEHEL